VSGVLSFSLVSEGSPFWPTDQLLGGLRRSFATVHEEIGGIPEYAQRAIMRPMKIGVFTGLDLRAAFADPGGQTARQLPRLDAARQAPGG